MQAVRFQFVINGDRLRDVPEYQQAKQLRIFGQCTVKELVQDYINSKPTIHPSNLTMLRQFMRDPLTSKTVLELTRQDVNRFKERRLNDTWKPPGSTGEPKQISPRTVRRHMNIIAMVFHHAINFKDGFAALPNHFLGHTVKGGKGGKRDRTLEDGEEARLMAACNKCLVPNNYFVPLAIYLAIYTAMRRAEIMNLMWADIDIVNRRIRIRKSKADKATGKDGTTIVLPFQAMLLLRTLATVLFAAKHQGNFPQLEQRIFPMTERALSQAYSQACRRAGITDLHFHDLRREASMRFRLAGLTVEERNIMRNHADKSMDATYTGKKLLLDGIRDKLDRYALEGMTLKEVMEKHGGIEWEDVLGSDMVLPMNEHFDMVAHPKRLAVTHTK